MPSIQAHASTSGVTSRTSTTPSGIALMQLPQLVAHRDQLGRGDVVAGDVEGHHPVAQLRTRQTLARRPSLTLHSSTSPSWVPASASVLVSA